MLPFRAVDAAKYAKNAPRGSFTPRVDPQTDMGSEGTGC